MVLKCFLLLPHLQMTISTIHELIVYRKVTQIEKKINLISCLLGWLLASAPSMEMLCIHNPIVLRIKCACWLQCCKVTRLIFSLFNGHKYSKVMFRGNANKTNRETQRSRRNQMKNADFLLRKID